MGIINFGVTLIRHSTQRKHFFRWIASFRKDYLFKTKQPWLTFDAIDFLNSLPLENKRVFEFGSGSSTLFWLEHRCKLVSVEHDHIWYNRLCNRYLCDKRCDYRFVPPEYIGYHLFDISNPNSYASLDELYPCHSFWEYCNQIQSFPDNYFDYILIDGRARPSCIKHSCQKVKIGGFLILDNSDREYYLKISSKFLHGYDRITFWGIVPEARWFCETSFFRRKY